MRIVFVIAFLYLTSIPTTLLSAAHAKGGVSDKSRNHDRSLQVVKKSRDNSKYLQGKIVVKLIESTMHAGAVSSFSKRDLEKYASRYAARSVSPLFPAAVVSSKGKRIDLSRFYIIEYASPVDAFTVAEELSAMPDVEYAEPCFIYHVSADAMVTPNDTAYYRQWHLLKVKADTAWSVSQGDSTVVIGIVDTGVQLDHPDLQGHIYINPGEDGPDGLGGNKRTNVIDDDGNGKVDDYRGWDFVGGIFGEFNEDNNPSPTAVNNAHGTHVAGIAGAVTNNVTGIASVSFNARLFPIKASADNDNQPGGVSIFTFPAFRGIVYAAQMGAQVINLSWGGPGASQFEQDMIDSASALGAVIVAAGGNTATAAELQYPASYRNVLSVASTQFGGDLKSSFSSYNEMIDVAAPGGGGSTNGGIYSTWYPNTYNGSMQGTSMASPLVAGVAALVRSRFPAYTQTQVAEQVRVTCDTAMYSANASYRYKLGKGLVNAYRALTETSFPSVRMTAIIPSDSAGGNNNGSLEPNEDVRLVMTFTNYLSPTTAANVYLASTDPGVTVTNGYFALGALGTLSSSTNESSPFMIHVNSGIAPAKVVTFTLRISQPGYSDIQQFTLLFNPTFATHSVNNVDVTMMNNGRIGFVDINNGQGVGFVFGNGNQLYESGLMIGSSSTKIVDCIRTDVASPPQNNDFASSQVYSLLTPGTISGQDGSTMFTDIGAPLTNRIGLQVSMKSYAFVNAPDDDYIIVQYDMINTSGSALTGIRAGLFFDWDMLPPGSVPNYWTRNRAAFESGRNLGYAWYDTTGATVYCGARALEGATGYYGLLIASAVPTRANKWAWLNGGIVPNDTTGDVHFVISSGPYNISAGATQRIAFALIGGDSLADLQANADAAQSKWNYIKTVLGVGDGNELLPTRFALHQNYPNPFNPVTTLAYDLPQASVVTIRVFDILGREIAQLLDNVLQEPGRYSIPFDASRLSSGVYFYRLQAGAVGAGSQGGYTEMKKLMLVK